MDIGIGGVLEQRIALDGVAILVAIADLPQRRPGADVAPAHFHGEDGGLVGLLHDRVVDRDAGRLGEGFRIEPQEAQVLRRLGERLAGGFADGRLEAAKLLQEGFGAQNEDAAVPGVGAGGEIAARSLLVGLFGERLDVEHAGELREGIAAADVAVARVRTGGRDAEQHEASRGRHVCRPAHRADEGGLILDDLVGRGHDQDARWVLARHMQRGNRDGGCRIARHGLEHDRARACPDAPGLLLNQEAVVGIADDGWRLEAQLGSEPLQRGGKEARGLAAGEADELLGVHGPRQRPQPRAGAAGKDDRKKVVHCALPCLRALPRAAALTALHGALKEGGREW